MNNLSSAVGAPPIAFPGDAIMTFPVELGPSVRVPLARCAQLQVNFVSLSLAYITHCVQLVLAVHWYCVDLPHRHNHGRCTSLAYIVQAVMQEYR